MTSIAIVGAGAIGGIVAWHLARAGHAPVLVARPATARALAERGLGLTGPGVDGVQQVAATDDPRRLGVQDIVIVGYKAQDWLAGLALVTPLVGPETLLVPLLNGVPWWFFQEMGGPHAGRVVEAVDPGGVLARSFAPRQIRGCVVYVAASRPSPTQILWNGRKRFVLGAPDGAIDARLLGLVALLRQAGLDGEASPQIRAELWSKLLGNATYNPLSAITGTTIGRLAGHPPLRAIVRAIMAETLAVGQALGACGAIDLDQRLAITPAMEDVKTSMLQDLEAGRAPELGAIVEAVVELGRLTGTPTPILQATGALAAECFRRARG